MIYYEDKNETACIPKDLGGYLSINHLISVPVWRAIVCHSFIPADFFTDDFAGALDGLYWRSVRGITYQQILFN